MSTSEKSTKLQKTQDGQKRSKLTSITAGTEAKTLQELEKRLAMALVQLEYDLNEANEYAGMLWKAIEFSTEKGKMMVLAVKHPTIQIGIQHRADKIAFTVNGVSASEAARKKVK